MHDKNSTAHSATTNDPPPLRSPYLRPAVPIQETLADGVKPGEPRSADRIHTTDTTRPNLPKVRQIYAIIDSVTDEIIGGLQTHINDQSAIRFLWDVALSEKSIVRNHPLDFDLYRLGALGNDHRIHPNFVRIITGAQIQTMIDSVAKTGER